MAQSGLWTVVSNTTYANEYAFKGDQWMTYETPETIEQKVFKIDILIFFRREIALNLQ